MAKNKRLRAAFCIAQATPSAPAAAVVITIASMPSAPARRLPKHGKEEAPAASFPCGQGLTVTTALLEVPRGLVPVIVTGVEDATARPVTVNFPSCTPAGM